MSTRPEPGREPRPMGTRPSIVIALLAVAAFATVFGLERSNGEERAGAAARPASIDAPPSAPTPSLTAAARLPRLRARDARPPARKHRRRPAPAASAPPVAPAPVPVAPAPAPVAPPPVAPAPAPEPPAPSPPPDPSFYDEG